MMRRILLAFLLSLATAPGWAISIDDLSSSIVTPNGDGFNDQVLIDVDNPSQADLDGRLYDAAGHEIASLDLVSSGPQTKMSWNGRSSSGAAVESGVYIFRITGDDSHVAGVLAVAR